MATTRLGLETLTENQASAEITVNQTLARLDALSQCFAKDWLDIPPGDPDDHDVYLVGSTPTGDWSGYGGYITFYYSGEWNFVQPKEGMVAYVDKIGGLATDKLYFYDGTSPVVVGGWVLGPILEETPEDADTADKDAISGHIVFPEDKSYVLELFAYEPYTIDKVSALLETGTCNIRLSVNGTPMGTSVSVSGSISHQAEAIAITADDKIELVVSSSSTPGDLSFTIAITKPLGGDD
jgi:hypothetical protein